MRGLNRGEGTEDSGKLIDGRYKLSSPKLDITCRNKYEKKGGTPSPPFTHYIIKGFVVTELLKP